MPAEILERILSYLSFKQRICAQRTKQRIREITLTPKLWKNITIRGHLTTNSVMRNILRAQTTSLDIPDCIWRANPREEIEMENHLVRYRPKLTYLGLRGFGGNNAIIATLIFLVKNLTTLDLSEADFALLSHILNKIDRMNPITSINLSIMRKPLLRRMTRVGNEQTSALGEMYSPIRHKSISGRNQPDMPTSHTHTNSD